MLLFNEFSIPFIIALMLVLLVGMTIHEFAHCVMATWWGDPTPREQGRLTLNPMVHIYWPGWLMFLVLGFGILGYAPVNERRMRDPRWGSFWTSAAGPLSNILIAVISAFLLRLFYSPMEAYMIFANSGQVASIPEFIALTLVLSIFFNLLLFVFNLLPFYPIDGWRMMLALLPGSFLTRDQIPAGIRKNARPLAAFLQSPAYKWRDWAQLSQYALLILIFLSFVPQINLLGSIIGGPTSTLFGMLMGL